MIHVGEIESAIANRPASSSHVNAKSKAAPKRLQQTTDYPYYRVGPYVTPIAELPQGLPLGPLPRPLSAPAPYVAPRQGAPHGADGSAMLEDEEVEV